MKKTRVITYLFYGILAGIFLLLSSISLAAETDDALKALQEELDTLKQHVSETQNYNRLGTLNESLQDLITRTNKSAASVQSNLAQIQVQREILVAPDNADVAEVERIATEKTGLDSQSASLQDQIRQLESITADAKQLSQQIINLRRSVLENQLSLRSYSILSPRFWSSIMTSHSVDEEKISRFYAELRNAFLSVWQPEWRITTILMLTIALLLVSVVRRALEHLIAWIGVNKLPNGRLRRSFIAVMVVVITVTTFGIAANLAVTALLRGSGTTSTLMNFAGAFLRLCLFCALLVGFGRAFLSNQRPSWRLPAISDQVARATGPFPGLIAGLILVFGAFELINDLLSVSVSKTVLTYSMTSLAMIAWALTAMTRVGGIRRKLAEQTGQPLTRSFLEVVLYAVLIVITLLVTLSLLLGYISLARFLVYELLWASLVMLSAYLLICLLEDVCEAVFSPDTPCGQYLKSVLKFEDRRLAQIASLLTAFGKVVLVMFAIVFFFKGTFGSTTPSELLDKTVEFMGADGLGKIDIAPLNILNALVFLAVALYLLRLSRRWLQDDYLPKTTMDTGIQASVLALFSNLGYALIVLLTLSTLGLQWNNLTWIVSALSVGIGFGLQEIVKNFISGLILLTERPVKVGDLISINGVEGDIRRIKVRATEIQLTDRSTVIVPNSQFISQSVRNVTMDNARGVVTIALNFPLNIDPEQVSSLLLESFRDNEAILDNPVPSITFSQLSPDGIVLTVTGHVSSPRVVTKTKSALLFEILKNLRSHGIAMSSPATIVVENKQSNIIAESE